MPVLRYQSTRFSGKEYVEEKAVVYSTITTNGYRAMTLYSPLTPHQSHQSAQYSLPS